MVFVKDYFRVLTAAFLLFPLDLNASSLEESPDQESVHQAFKKLRKHPAKLDFADLTTILDTVIMSRSIKKMPSKKKNGESLVRSHYEDAKFYYSVLFHQPWDNLIKPELMNSYYIQLKALPTFNLFKLATRLEFELGLDHVQRVCDFQIVYLRKLTAGVSKEIPAVKTLQHKQTNKAVKKFLSKRSLLQERTINKAKLQLTQAQERAEEVKKTLTDQYAQMQGASSPTLIADIPGDKRRTFAKKRGQSASILPRRITKHADLEKPMHGISAEKITSDKPKITDDEMLSTLGQFDTTMTESFTLSDFESESSNETAESTREIKE